LEQQRPVHKERVNDEATLDVLRSLGVNWRESPSQNKIKSDGYLLWGFVA
jgi:hypothetical protein